MDDTTIRRGILVNPGILTMDVHQVETPVGTVGILNVVSTQLPFLLTLGGVHDSFYIFG